MSKQFISCFHCFYPVPYFEPAKSDSIVIYWCPRCRRGTKQVRKDRENEELGNMSTPIIKPSAPKINCCLCGGYGAICKCHNGYEPAPCDMVCDVNKIGMTE